nr:hypothetical protein [Tanacetum cinerariifolium]
VVQNAYVVDTSDLQTELERTKERFENCIIKKETEYAKLWNDWYKKCDECKYDKISYDKSYKDMQQKIERLQAQLRDLKCKCKYTSCVSDTQNQLSQKLENANVELEFQVLNYARENVHLKATYKNLFDSISVSRVQTETKIASLQNELQCNIYKNAKLRMQLFKKVSDQKDNSQDSITSNSVSTPQVSKGVNNDKVIAPGMFRISLDKKCLNSINHDKCLSNYMSGKKSCGKNQMAKVSVKEIQKKYQPKASNPKKVGTRESLATPKPRKPRFLLRWSPTGRLFDQDGKRVAPSNSESHVDCSNGCSKHMTGNLKLLINFVWKFMGTVRFGNDHVAAILGFGDLQWGNILITRVYFVEGLGHNLFSVGQFCDSDIESWLWHQRLSYLNFDTINDLAKNDLVACLPKFKYHKEHICPSCEQGKSKRASHPPKPVPNTRQRLHLLHMDLCGPMRIASINGKRYVFVIVDDYSRYTWVHFLRSKDEAPAVIITFLKRITVLLQSLVIIIRTDNDTEFKNQVLKVYFDSVGISQQMSSVRTPQQNGVVERRNRTLVEAARTMLIFSRAPLFLWAEAIATACFTQNRSIIHRRFNKTPYELINGKKLDISFIHVFSALCYPKNDREDIGKLGAKGDIGFFIGYSADSCAYKIYNRRTTKIMKTMNVSFDELSAMAFEQRSSKPGLQRMTSGHISSGLDLNYAPSTITKQQLTEGELDLLFEAMYDDYFGGQP